MGKMHREIDPTHRAPLSAASTELEDLQRLTSLDEGPTGALILETAEPWNVLASSETLPMTVATLAVSDHSPHRSFFDLVHAEDGPLLRQTLDELIRTPDSSPEILLRLGGGISPPLRWMHARFECVRPLGASTPVFRAYLTDVTGCKNAQASLEESEIRFSTLFESAQDAIFVLQDELFVDCNPRTLDIFRCSREQIIGHRPYELSPELQPDGQPSRDKAMALISAAMAGDAQFFQWQHRRPDGSDFLAEVTLNRVDLHNGPHIQAIVRDISAREMARAAIRDSETNLRRLNRVLRTVSEINRIVGLSEDVDDLLRRACEALVTQREYGFAWVALVQDKGPRVQLRAASTPIDPLPFSFSLGDADVGPTCVAEAIRSQEIYRVDAEHVDDGCDSCLLVSEFPTRTALALPLVRGGRSLGALVVHASESGVFDPEETALLGELADNIAYAVESLEGKRQRAAMLLALHETGVDLSAERNLDKLLRAIVDRAERLLGAPMGGLYLMQEDGSLQLVVAHGALQPYIGTRIEPGEGVCGRVVQSREPMLIENYGNWPHRAQVYEQEMVGTVIGAPIIWFGEVLGAIHVDSEAENAFGAAEVELVSLFAEQAAVAIANARLFDELELANVELARTYDATLEGWVRALDLRDKETEGHTQRVTEKTVHLARAMGLDEEDLVHIRRGALLHDIGKIGIPDRILLKPGPLTAEERAVMQRHTSLAHDMLSGIPYLRQALKIPSFHHERWNGSGYPHGLKGAEIPLAARIFAVVDVADALSYDRPYRRAWPRQRVMKYIQERSGTDFDPQVVDEFLRFENGG